MLQKYSKWLMVVAIPAWVGISFFAAQAIVVGVIWVLGVFKISLSGINEALLNTIFATVIYMIAILFVIGAPWLIKKKKTSLKDLGLDNLPSWMDILLAPAGFVVYIVLSSLLIMLASSLFSGFDANQIQEVGFNNLSSQFEYILAFVVLVVAIPVAEEVLFRGFLFGKLKRLVPVWVAVIVTSVLFGVLHGSWNVAIDTIALSVVLCVLRQITGSLWPSILLHMIKNGVAFYFLFINTSFLTTLGR